MANTDDLSPPPNHPAPWRAAGTALFATLDARINGIRRTVRLVGREEMATLIAEEEHLLAYRAHDLRDDGHRAVARGPQQQPPKKAMSMEEARNLPFHFFRPVNTRERYRGHEGCVCLEDYRKCEHLVELPCGHRLHRKCGTKWLQESATCPYCRADADAITRRL